MILLGIFKTTIQPISAVELIDTCLLPLILVAAALKCMGGSFQGRLWPRNDQERSEAFEQGYDLNRILLTEDLCKVCAHDGGQYENHTGK